MNRIILLIIAVLTASFNASSAVTIIHNVIGNTINNNKHISFNAVAIENGKVLKIGSDIEVQNTYPKALLVDGKGRSMLPGLHDAHGHVYGLAQLKNQIDLMSVTSIDESLEIIQRFIDKNPDNNWILGRGWNQALWNGKKFPTFKDLDRLKTDKPIWLRRVDGHAGWANSKAMEIAKTTNHLKDLPGGEIITDAQGIQTGIFIDNAMNIIETNIKGESPSKANKQIHQTLSYLASLGITSVDDAGVDWNSYNAYMELSNNKNLPIRVNVMLASGSKVLEKMLAAGTIRGDFLQIQTIKYVMDGALGSRGAALLEPYSDRKDSNGKLVQSKDFIQNIIYKNADQGWQAAIHAIGDRANKIAIDIYTNKNANTNNLRHRIEHAQIVDFNDLKKFKDYHIIASMQPTHATSDMNMAQDRLGRQRLRGAYAWQTLLKKGVVIASGSDFPVELANPFYGLHAAVTRQDRNNQPQQGWIGIESMSVKQALASFTIHAAYANHRESSIGSIQAGKWADFILVDQDIFTVQPKDIWKTKVLQTWVSGQKIYDINTIN